MLKTGDSPEVRLGRYVDVVRKRQEWELTQLLLEIEHETGIVGVASVEIIQALHEEYEKEDNCIYRFGATAMKIRFVKGAAECVVRKDLYTEWILDEP